MIAATRSSLSPRDRVQQGVQLTVDGLQLTDGMGHELIQRLSLDVPCGATFGLVGESGSGKSLVCRAIMGMTPPGVRMAAGSISFSPAGGSDSGTVGQCAAMIYQNHHGALSPTSRAGRALMLTVRAQHPVSRRTARAEALGLLERVGFRDPVRAFGSYPHQLSGGMRQRLGIALALACRPRVLIADEPTTALDALVQRGVLGLLRNVVREEGMSLLMVSHDISVIGAMCDHIGVMYAGQIVETGPARSVLDDPVHPYTRALLACDARHGSGRLRSIRGSVPPPGARQNGCLFASRCDFAERACTESPVELTRKHERWVRCRLAGTISSRRGA
ncbi:ABC transporter ATP-binding protein [Streptomyces sp. NPDC004752]